MVKKKCFMVMNLHISFALTKYILSHEHDWTHLKIIVNYTLKFTLAYAMTRVGLSLQVLTRALLKDD